MNKKRKIEWLDAEVKGGAEWLLRTKGELCLQF